MQDNFGFLRSVITGFCVWLVSFALGWVFGYVLPLHIYSWGSDLPMTRARHFFYAVFWGYTLLLFVGVPLYLYFGAKRLKRLNK